MRIFIEAPNGNIFAFQMCNSDKISELKLKIEKALGIKLANQILFRGTEVLDNEKSLEQCGVMDQSLININIQKGMEIILSQMGRKSVKIRVGVEDTIRSIKQRIERIFSLVSNRQRLQYKGEILKDEETVDDCGIEEGDEIVVVAMIWVYIKMWYPEKVLYIYVAMSDKIIEIKRKIRAIIDASKCDYRLIFYGTSLRDEETVEHCGIKERDTIMVVISYKGGGTIYPEHQIFLLPINGKYIRMQFAITDGVDEIKARIRQEIGLTERNQEFNYYGKMNYNGEIMMKYRSSGGPLLIVSERKVFQCNADGSPIEDIKRRIQQEIGLDKQHQKLVIHTTQLDDDQLSYEYSILDRLAIGNCLKDGDIITHRLLKEAIKNGSLQDFSDCKSEIKHGSYSMSPFLYACKFGNEEIVKNFIQNISNFETVDCQRRRALHYAAISKNGNLVNQLIDKGADINAPDSLLMMPIHLACQANNIEAARLLMMNNCDINSLDGLNRSPLQIAEKGGFEEMIRLIKEYEMIREMADEMQLKCGNSCSHKLFCYKSIQTKKFEKNHIGNGSYGAVYVCTQSESSKFAVKCIHKKCNESKYIEANINKFKKTLCHKNIVKHFGAYQKKQENFIFMEYCDYGSLDKKIEKDKILLLDTVILYTKQLLEALAFLHERNIIHRDIKPANVMLDVNENLKLGDFGWSLLLSSVADEVQEAGTFCGTLCYMAPEIGKLKYSCSVDIWSLGVTVIELCTGETPHLNLGTGRTLSENIPTQKIDYKLPPNMPAYMKDLIDRMLDRDPISRASATVLLDVVKYHCLLAD